MQRLKTLILISHLKAQFIVHILFLVLVFLTHSQFKKYLNTLNLSYLFF